MSENASTFKPINSNNNSDSSSLPLTSFRLSPSFPNWRINYKPMPQKFQSKATTGNSGAPPITNQYTLNGAIGSGYACGTPAEWMTDSQQIQSPQTNIPPQMSTAYNVMFDPSQQPTYAHPNQYETSTYFSQQSQQPS